MLYNYNEGKSDSSMVSIQPLITCLDLDTRPGRGLLISPQTMMPESHANIGRLISPYMTTEQWRNYTQYNYRVSLYQIIIKTCQMRCSIDVISVGCLFLHESPCQLSICNHNLQQFEGCKSSVHWCIPEWFHHEPALCDRYYFGQ